MRKQSTRPLFATMLCLAASPLVSQRVAAGPVRTVPAATAASMIAIQSDQTPVSEAAVRIDASAASAAPGDGRSWNAPLIGMAAGVAIGFMVLAFRPLTGAGTRKRS